MSSPRYPYNIGLQFAAVAGRAGARRAIVTAAGTVSYQELNELANRMAGVLHARGFRRRDVLAIVHKKSIIAYATMLAALKLGIIYVNIDDQNPPARLEHIFRSCRPKAVFAKTLDAGFADTAAAIGAEIVRDDERLRSELAASSPSEPAAMGAVLGSDPAYIMYTSGSTGVPKGAIMTHGGVLNFGEWIGSRFGVTEHDVMSNVNPMYFDNSVFDFYGAMLNGSALAPVPRELLSDANGLLAHVDTAGVTIWFSVPSMLIYLMSMKSLSPDRFSSIRSFVFGGEGFPKPELRKLYRMYSDRATFINVYGPTECTCMCSAWNVSEADLADDEGFVTLGPIAENFSALVLDENRPVLPGEVGELCLVGPQVGLGYINDPERTKKAFVPNPLNDAWQEPMYRTGDLVRLGNDGQRLDFIGRRDNQIKHMGYRIELEEIEAGINRLKGVIRSAVLQKTIGRGAKIIVAYVAAEGAPTEGELRAELESYLPPYMIPQRFDVRSDLPKNANGKIDKVALLAEPI